MEAQPNNQNTKKPQDHTNENFTSKLFVPLKLFTKNIVEHWSRLVEKIGNFIDPPPEKKDTYKPSIKPRTKKASRS